MDYRPRLREHVGVEQTDEGGTLLADHVLIRRVELSPKGVALLARLDGRAFADAVLSTDDQTIFRRFLLLNLVDGAGDGIVNRVRGVRRGEQDLGISLLEGARFECQGSGECCQNYVFGPLEDADIARLDKLDLRAAFPHVEPPYVEQLTREDGSEMRFLKSVDDRCVFLEGDKKCGLHRRFGAESKPKLCRMYPLEIAPTLDGVRIYDKGSCATFATSARSGLPLLDDLERLLKLMPTEVEGLYHPIVKVDEYPCDFGHYDRYAKTCIQLAKRPERSAPHTLRAIARGLRHFAQTLRSFPLEPGQPDAAIDALLAGDHADWFDGEPRPGEVREGAFQLSSLFSALLVSISGAIGKSVREQGFLSQRLLREAAQLFHVAGVLALHVAEPDEKLDPYFAALAATTVGGPEIHDVLRLSIRQQLFGLESLADDHALAGMIGMVLSQVLSVAGARVRAVNEGRSAATASDLSWGHMLAARVLRKSYAAPMLIGAESAFSAILEALPAVVALS